MSEPEYPLTINGEEFKAGRKNTTLFTYLGETGIYDHVYLVFSETETEYSGCYVFKVAQEQLYAKLGNFIVANNFPQVLNRDTVPQCDQDAWNGKMLGDLGDAPPWNDLDQQS